MAKILVVEDDSDTNQALCDLLAEERFALVTAHSGAEALRLLRAERPDLMVLDADLRFEVSVVFLCRTGTDREIAMLRLLSPPPSGKLRRRNEASNDEGTSLSRCRMTITPQQAPPRALLAKFIIPVRYVSGGAVVQTTSTSLTRELIHVRSAHPPRAGLVIGLQLYFPNVGEVVGSTGLIAETTAGPNSGFWAELADDERNGDRIAVLLARHRDLGDRGCPRFHTHLRATIHREGRSAHGYITNISRSGAFVHVDSLPPLGSIVDLDMAIPGGPGRETVLAYVVHVAERRGIGVQFIGGSDEFRSRLDEYVSRLAG
jgi:hypothetical protein